MQRLRDHERFEMAMLHWLGSKRFLGSLAFGGGTMLRLCHELPRYSLDMDFWFFKVIALIDRGEIRDAFDLEFLVRKGVPLELTEDQRQEVLKRLQGFKKKDFAVKLGSILEPDLRDYYRRQRFAYLEEKLSFDIF